MEHKIGRQNLTEEEEVRVWIPNRNLQLTQKAEIERLRKVINEKDALIEKFKRYDSERTEYCHRLEQNYSLMEERFGEFADAINDCDEIDDGTKEFYKEVVSRLYKGKVTNDKEKSVLQVALSRLTKMQDNFNSLEFEIMGVGNTQKRSELLNEHRKLVERYTNVTSSFIKSMGELR